MAFNALGLFTLGVCSAAWAAPAPRVTWNSASLTQIHGNGARYGRIVRVDDDHLIAAFVQNGSGGGVVTSKHSFDNGRTWVSALVVATNPLGSTNNAELVRLASGRMILSYGNRPATGYGPDYSLSIAFSDNDGLSWYGHKQVYGGGQMWEPNIVELPNGTLHLYFANEKAFADPNLPPTAPNDQSIDRLTSTDGGATWSAPERISYRSGRRDGMPVTQILQNGNLVAIIEDSGWDGKLKPTIIDVAETTPQGSVITGNDSRRWLAHAGGAPLATSIAAGAPYLQQLVGGATVLSYQGADTSLGTADENRRMGVAVGDSNSRNFRGDSQPFAGRADAGTEQTWPSVFDKGPLTITALANATISGANGLWAIDGRVRTERLAYDASDATRSTATAWSDQFEEGAAAAGWDWALDAAHMTRVAVTSAVPGITQAYRFNGAGGAAMTSFDSLSGVTNRDATFEFWVRPTTLTDRKGTLFETGGSVVGLSLTLFNDELKFRIDNDGVLQSLNGEQLDGVVAAANVRGRMSTTEFNQVIARVENVGGGGEAAVLSLFLNGTLVAQAQARQLLGWSGGNGAGLGTSNSDDNWDGATLLDDAFLGDIANFRFYDRSLLNEEIAALTADVRVSYANADFNSDGQVNGSDFLTWQRGEGFSKLPSEGDANGDNVVDVRDLGIWREQFGAPSAAGRSQSLASVASEPAATALAAGVVLGLGATHGRPGHRRKLMSEKRRSRL